MPILTKKVFNVANYCSGLIPFVLLLLAFGCKTPDDLNPSSNSSATSANSDWTTQSHSDSVSPDYSVVFPQTQVNKLEITLTADQWKSIQSDMVAKSWGTFGTSSGGNNPGQGGGGFGEDPEYVDVPVQFNGKTWTHVGFRLKGNSSLSSAWRSGIYKLPFRMHFDKFEDTYTAIKNQRFYGFKELSMSPGYSDNSLIREKLTADIFRQGGIPSAQTAFYQVYINFGSGSQYCGVYTMVEVIDDSMIKTQFGEKKGNIYKPESKLKTFTQSEFEKKNNETTADYSDVQAFVTALNSTTRTTNAAQWRTTLESSFNVEYYLKYLAINNTIVNWDVYGAMAHNYYLYNSPSGKLTWIPWDFNMSMSTSTSSGNAGGQGAGGGGNQQAVSLAMTEVTTEWPLIYNIANDPVYYAKYKEYVNQFTATVFTTTNLATLIDSYHNLIAPYVVGPTATETGKYTYLSGTSSFNSSASDLKAHVATRNTAVTTFLK